MEMTGNKPSATPGKESASLAKTKVGGALFVLGGLVMAYYFILRPLQEGQRTGQMHYYMKGILLPPAFVYSGLVVLLFDMRDGQIRTTGPDGKPKLTRKGKWFIGGLLAVLGLTVAAWLWYLHTIGFTEA